MSAVDVARALRLARAAVAEGREAVTGVVVSAPDPRLLGRRIVLEGGRFHGSLEDPASTADARRLLEAGGPAGCHRIAGGLELYVERWEPPPELVIVGAGHIARPLVVVADLLEYRVTVVDDRPEFATRARFPEADRVVVASFDEPFAGIPIGGRTSLVLVTRGHRHDYDCLRALARSEVDPAYIGMIGSRRRVRAAFEQLAREGIGAEWLSRIHAPLGLDIGAETPAEIAVAVAAEIVLAARGGSGRPLSERADILRHVRALADPRAVEGAEQ